MTGNIILWLIYVLINQVIPARDSLSVADSTRRLRRGGGGGGGVSSVLRDPGTALNGRVSAYYDVWRPVSPLRPSLR